MHAAPEGFQRARADWQALFAEKGSLQGRSVRSFDILYGISFSAEGIGGTSVTAVYNLDLESGRARLALDLQPDWQSWKISNLEIQY